jgi:hypothetical protein
VATRTNYTATMSHIDELLDRTPRGLLYHYTSAHGFLGILHEGSIWASSAYHLNDAKDFRYAVTFILDRLRYRLDKERGPWNKEYGVIEQELLTVTEDIQAYVASFSEDGDLLSQWLTYSGSGNGYAIGLSASHFSLAKQKGFMLVPCIYGEEEKIEFADAIVDVLCLQIQNGESPEDRTESRQADFRKALVAMAAIKHAGFQREAEWRLVKALGVGWDQSKDVLFRSGRNGVVPYLQSPLRPDGGPAFVPDSIHIGPRDDMEGATIAIRTLLDSLGLLTLSKVKVAIMPSGTPFRP